MEITGGGTVASARGYIGFNSGSDGAVTVSGAGSRWDATGSIWAGNGGVGSLEITDGAVVATTGNCYLGFSTNTSGYIRVNGALSSLAVGARIWVGGTTASAGGSGTLQIENGATVSGLGTTIYPGAYLNLGTGAVLDSPLTIQDGNIAAGTIDFPNDMTVSSGNLTVYTSTSDPTFSGEISGPGGLTKGSLGFIAPSPGTLTLSGQNSYTGATIVSAGRLIVDGSVISDVTVNNGATLGGSGAVGSVTVNSGGVINPGNSPGKLTVNGNYHQTSGGTLNIEIGGNTAGESYDQLEVTGTAALDGALNLTLVNNFRPAVGDTFAILTSSVETGGFSTINAEGFDADVEMSGGGVMLTVTAVDPLLRVTNLARGEDQLVITFDATGGNSYRLEHKTSLNEAEWEEVPGVEDITPAENGPADFTAPFGPNDTRAFYRVRLVP